ncbi:MAG: M1 family metallopeptidase [Crocinitomicaceae bacterium]|nr:M1 family metallopeptidase [Crocinitomicaceae bacterium]
MKKIIVGAILFTLVACGTKPTEEDVVVVETTTTNPKDEIEFIEDEAPVARAVYRESETILTDLVHTKLEVNFMWEKSQMNGVATITAKPHFYATDSLILDAKAMIINSVEMDGKKLNYSYQDSYIRIHLGREYTRDEDYTVVIDYVARPEEREAGGSSAITSDMGLYFINPMGEDPTKMPQIWTQGETESSSVWFPTIDAPNAKTTQEIYITVDDKYVTLSNGALISSKKIADGKRVDHWKQDLPHAPYLFMMGIGEFKVVKDSYTRPDGTSMEVNYYVEPEWEEFAADIFGETPEMIKFFSERLGVEYPWDKYHQIVCRDYVSGAMENTGAVIFGDFVYKSKRELLDENDQSTIAHELFHHWFGDLVTCESWSNLTLNESFANYSQYLWDEHRYGLDEADHYAEIEAEGYFQSAQMGGFHNLAWFDYDDKEDMFDGHSYNKGGRILHMLRSYLGDDAFFEAIHLYLEDNKFQAAEFHHLRLAFEEVCGEDLNWFFKQWYEGAGHPNLKFEQDVDEVTSEVTVTVTQNQDMSEWPIFKLPVNMAIYDDEGKHVYEVVIDQVEQTFTFPFKGEVKGIMYDDQQMLLAKTNKDKSTAQYIYQFYHGERYAARKDGLMKGSRDRGEAGQKLVLDAMKDPFWNIRLLAIGKMSKLKDANKEAGIELIKELVANDPSSAVRGAALTALGKLLKGEELKNLYIDRIENDPSYSVITTALQSLGKSDPDKAMELAAVLEKENSSKMLSGVAQLYAGYGELDKYTFFEQQFAASTIQGFDRLGLMNSFTMFVARQDADAGTKAFDIYKNIGENGSFYMKMFLGQNIGYISRQYSAKLVDLEEELKKHEESGDAAYADQTRKKIVDFTKLKEMYSAFEVELEEGDESGH